MRSANIPNSLSKGVLLGTATGAIFRGISAKAQGKDIWTGHSKNSIEIGPLTSADGVKVDKTAEYVEYTEGSGYVVDSRKYDYFFGRVVTGDQDNILRSAQNLKDLTTLGIRNEQQLNAVFDQAINGTVQKTITNSFGTTLMKSIDIGTLGRINVSFFYTNGNFNSIPKITSIIPQIFK